MFQDKARGEPGGSRELASVNGEDTHDVEALVFQMTSALAQLKRLVDGIGGPRDTLEHRQRIADTNSRIQSTARDVKARVTALSGAASAGGGAAGAAGGSPRVVSAKAQKLLRDFAAVLQDYKATQKLAAQREASCLPRTPARPPPGAKAGGAGAPGAASAEGDIESQALLQHQQQLESRAVDRAISYNEALIEERDQGIAEIQRQIGEVNEMFQDLAVLIHDQGQQVQTVDLHISSVAERTREGARELVRAEASQRAARNKWLMLWLIAGLVVAVLMVILFA